MDHVLLVAARAQLQKLLQFRSVFAPLLCSLLARFTGEIHPHRVVDAQLNSDCSLLPCRLHELSDDFRPCLVVGNLGVSLAKFRPTDDQLRPRFGEVILELRAGFVS